jgi:DNA-binding transcriptional regulator YhcF (GntR family)
MQQKSRRQFVTASLAGLPMLAYSSSAAPAAFAPQAASRGPGAAILVDPVLDQTITTLRELVAEGEAKPASRKASARAIEATLGIQAAHIGLHYDAQVQRGLRRRQARVGRAALIEEMVKSARDHKRHHVTHELVDAVLTKLEHGGFSSCLRDLQRTIRAARLNAPDAYQAAALLPAQYDFCSDVRMMIEAAEIAAGIICSIAVLEPTLALEPFCAAAGLIVASYKALQWLWC